MQAGMSDEPMVPPGFAASLVEIGQRMDRCRWVPGSAGNFSARIDDERIAITRSGVHKGQLTDDDIIAVKYDGSPFDPSDRPSAETLLHCQIYQKFAGVGAVLHGHSVAATVLSMASDAGGIAFSNYEILKAFGGIRTHETEVILPVVDNDQDMPRLVARIEPLLEMGAPLGYLIRGHGIYAWGETVEHAFWRVEALEFLLACELERRRIK
jgi:methylthioribulose-1-phosphate dehydratase